jgi:hypothetical protein
MLKYFIISIFCISCSSPKFTIPGGKYSQKEFSYCGGAMRGYMMKIFAESSTSRRSPSLAIWFYTDTNSNTAILNYVINSKENLDVRFQERKLNYQVQDEGQRQYLLNFKLTIAALSPDNVYPYPKYKITPHDLNSKQWKVYKRGLFGELFLSDYKIVTMPTDQHKSVDLDHIKAEFDPSINEGIYLGDGTRVNLGPSKANVIRAKVRLPQVYINGVTLPSQILSFDLDIAKIKGSSKMMCPSMSDIFRWN